MDELEHYVPPLAKLISFYPRGALCAETEDALWRAYSTEPGSDNGIELPDDSFGGEEDGGIQLPDDGF